MKWNIILAGIFFAGGLALSPKQTDLRGTWQVTGADPCKTTVVRIEMGEGIWKGRIDQPAINKYNAAIRSIRLEKDSIIMEIDDQTLIKTRLTNDSSMSGSLMQNGISEEIVMIKR